MSIRQILHLHSHWLKSFLFFFCFFGLVSCRFQSHSDPRWLILRLAQEPSTLNLLTSRDAYAGAVEGFIYDTLIDRDHETYQFIPKLAERWEVSDDHLSYTFYLRKDVKWHDEIPFTAEDVVYSFERIMDPNVNAGHLRDIYEGIQAVDQLDLYTVRFIFKKPYFKAFESTGGMPIVAKHIFEKASDFNDPQLGRFPVGTGPYKFVQWDTGKRIVLERNEKYWDRSRFPDIRGITFRIITDSHVALEELKKKDLDDTELDPIQWLRQTSSENFKNNFVRHQFPAMMYLYVGWNLRNPLFQDKKVRQALTMLINRQEILEKLNFGLGRLISGPFLYESEQYDKTVAPYPYDPERAKQLLQEAGWIDKNGDGVLEKEGKKFEFQLLIRSEDDSFTRLATIIKEDFRKAGIEMNIQTMEFATSIDRLHNHEFDATIMRWMMGFDVDPYAIWHSSQRGLRQQNFIGYANPEVDALLEKAKVTFDAKERNEMYHQIHRILHEEQPYTFMFNPANLEARSARFQNVRVYPTGLDALEWKVMEQ